MGMLVLGLKVGERVRVGSFGWISYERFRGGAITLGFDFPRDVPIIREEIIDEDEDLSVAANEGDGGE